jgi:hypothetical protein
MFKNKIYINTLKIKQHLKKKKKRTKKGQQKKKAKGGQTIIPNY